MAFYPEIDRICLYTEEIDARVEEIAREISEAYEGRNLLVVGVLKGNYIAPTQVNYHHR